MGSVKGTPEYWKQILYHVLGMVKQLGILTYFFTLSMVKQLGILTYFFTLSCAGLR